MRGVMPLERFGKIESDKFTCFFQNELTVWD